MTMSYFTFKRAETKQERTWVHQLRYRVYCEERRFERPEDHPEGLEKDVHDDFSSHFLCLDATGLPVGTIRLILPGQRALPILEHCDIHKPIESCFQPHAGEISRLAISKLYRRRQGDTIYGITESSGKMTRDPHAERRGLPVLCLGLLREGYQEAVRQGLTHVYAVMERQLHVLLRRFGVIFKSIGPAVEYHGERVPHVLGLRDLESQCPKKRPDVFTYFREGMPDDLTAAATAAQVLASAGRTGSRVPGGVG
jgi:N-acyl amino acid synthase of PEP-CTERM/exosortase system